MPDLDQIKQGEQGARHGRGRFARGSQAIPPARRATATRRYPAGTPPLPPVFSPVSAGAGNVDDCRGAAADRALSDRPDAGGIARGRIRVAELRHRAGRCRVGDVARSRVEIRHVRGASDATYFVNAFGDELLDAIAAQCAPAGRRLPRAGARCARCEHLSPCGSNAGASAPSMPAGNSAGATRRSPAIPAGAMSKPIATLLPASDFLEDEPQQLYWRTDIVQMTRYYMIEAARSGIRLSPRRAGFPV